MARVYNCVAGTAGNDDQWHRVSSWYGANDWQWTDDSWNSWHGDSYWMTTTGQQIAMAATNSRRHVMTPAIPEAKVKQLHAWTAA